MKKLTLLLMVGSLTASTLLAGSFEENIKEIFKVHGGEAKEVVKHGQIKEMNDLEMVEVLFGNDDSEIFFANATGDKLMPPTVFIQADQNHFIPDKLKQIADEKQAQKEAKTLALYAKEPKDSKVVLGKDKKKETMIIFADPMCGYCKAKIADIDNILKEKNLEIYFLPILSPQSMDMSAWALERIKLGDDKLVTIKKVFGDDFKIPEKWKPNDKIKTNLMNGLKTFAESGLVRGVPHQIQKGKINAK